MAMSVMAAETHEVNELLSWGVGAGVLLILVLMLGALVAFGGGREHS